MGYKRAHRTFLNNVESYQKKVDALKNRQPDQTAVDKAGQALLNEFSNRIEKAGALPIFILPPRIKPEDALTKLQADGQLNNLLRFNDPQKYSALYSPESRFDEVHLNEKGAQLYTRLVTQGFVSYLNGDNLSNPASAQTETP